MAKKTRPILKGYFETGDTPSQSNYADFIDSKLNLEDTGTQTIKGTISASNLISSGQITASGNILASGNIVGDDNTNITNINTIECDSLVHDGDTDTKIVFGTDQVRTSAGNVVASTITPSSVQFNLPITASIISASGTIFANDFKSSGGDVSGVTFHDNLNITGSLTASGDISASGAIIANAFTLNGTPVGTSTDTFWNSGGAGKIFYNGGNIGIGTTNPGQHLEVIGNISASGTLFANSGSFNYITASKIDVDADTIRIGGESFSKTNLTDLKSGKPVTLDTAIEGFTSILRPQAIMSALNSNDYQKWSIAGRIGTFLSGALVHDMDFGSGKNHINMGKSDGTTKVKVTGSLIVSGSSTLTNYGNFTNYLKDTHKFNIQDSSFGTKPHINFIVSGSGHVGIGARFPKHTLHVSASSKNFKALQVEGESQFNGFVSTMGVGNATAITSNTIVPAGYNVILYTSNANPSININLGVNYTISAGADVMIKNMNNI